MSVPAGLRIVAGRPILYSFRRCPYAMRARLALLVSGTVCEIREVKLSHKPAEMIAASPKATVPVIVHPDGSVIEESLEIMRWALERNDPEGWLARDDQDLIEAIDGPFKRHLDRYKYPDRHASNPAEHRSAGLQLLSNLELRLASQTNLCGDERSITDAAVLPFVRQFAEVDRAWFDVRPLPHVQGWLERHVRSPLFNASMVRLQPWRSDNEPLRFPAD